MAGAAVHSDGVTKAEQQSKHEHGFVFFCPGVFLCGLENIDRGFVRL